MIKSKITDTASPIDSSQKILQLPQHTHTMQNTHWRTHKLILLVEQRPTEPSGLWRTWFLSPDPWQHHWEWWPLASQQQLTSDLRPIIRLAWRFWFNPCCDEGLDEGLNGAPEKDILKKLLTRVLVKIQMKIQNSWFCRTAEPQSSDRSSGSLDSDCGPSREAERSTGLTRWKQVCPLPHWCWTPGTAETVFTVRGKIITVIWGSVLNPLILQSLFPSYLWETSSHPFTHLMIGHVLFLFLSFFGSFIPQVLGDSEQREWHHFLFSSHFLCAVEPAFWGLIHHEDQRVRTHSS